MLFQKQPRRPAIKEVSKCTGSWPGLGDSHLPLEMGVNLYNFLEGTHIIKQQVFVSLVKRFYF